MAYQIFVEKILMHGASDLQYHCMNKTLSCGKTSSYLQYLRSPSCFGLYKRSDLTRQIGEHFNGFKRRRLKYTRSFFTRTARLSN